MASAHVPRDPPADGASWFIGTPFRKPAAPPGVLHVFPISGTLRLRRERTRPRTIRRVCQWRRETRVVAGTMSAIAARAYWLAARRTC
jgi:hypothetical protein